MPLARGCLAILLAVLLLGSARSASAADPGGFPKLAVESGWTSERYTHVLQRYAPADKDKRLCVNSLEAAEDCIHVLILTHKAVTDLIAAGAHPEVKGLGLNAKTLSAGYILIDDLLLDFIFINALNQKALMFADHAAPDPAVGAEPILVMTTVQQLANLRFTLKGDPELAATGWKTIHELADLWLAHEMDEASLKFTASFFSLLIEHEIAHLGIGLSWYEQLLRKGSLVFSRGALIEEERRADRLGMERIYTVVGDALGAGKPGYDERFADLMQGQPFTLDDVRHMLAAQHALSFANFLRDISLSTVFEGFRGSPAEQSIVTWIFKACGEREKRDAVTFGDPRDLNGAVLRDLPLLTAAEFAQMRDRWGGDVALATHDHNLVRAAAMYEEIGRRDRFGVYRRLIEEPYTGLLRALMENDPSLVWGRYGDQVHPLPKADKAAILSVLASHRVEGAVTCPEGDCHVAVIEGLGTIELISRGEQVLRLRASLTLKADHSEADIMALAALFALLQAAGLPQDEAGRVLIEMRKPVRECEFGTTRLDLPQASVFASSIDHKGKLFLDVHAPAGVP